MKNYEVAIYNQKVRDALREGDSHPNFSDDWGNLNYITFMAGSPEEAKKRAENKHPPNLGFVIESVTEL